MDVTLSLPTPSCPSYTFIFFDEGERGGEGCEPSDFS